MNPPRKPLANVIQFPDAHAAIDSLLDAWLPRLIESNEILTSALLRLRDLYLAEETPTSYRVLAEIEVALKRAAEARKDF